MALIRKEIKGRDVLKCTLIEKDRPYDEDTKMKGQKYSNYSLQGKVISINDKMDFAKDHKAGLVYSIDVLEGPSKDDVEKIVWSFAGYTTTTQEIKMAETESKLFSFTQALANVELTDADLVALKDD